MAATLAAAFPGLGLYEILGVPRAAPAAAIKKAYYKAALKYHPDRASTTNDADATRRFQALGVAHAVLSDADRRAAYDATGEVDNDEGGGGGGAASAATWSAYFRAQFPAFTERDIDAFADKYKGSPAEVEDVLAAYVTCKGDMDAMLEHVPCADGAASGAGSDVERFVAIMHSAFAAGTAEPLRAFTRLYGEEAEAAGGEEGAGGGRKRRGAGGGGGAAAGASPPKRKAGGDKAAAAAAAAGRSKRAAAEAAEAEEMLAAMREEHNKARGGGAGGGEPSLADMLRARQAARASAAPDFLSSLATKYGALEDKADVGGGSGKARGKRR